MWQVPSRQLGTGQREPETAPKSPPQNPLASLTPLVSNWTEPQGTGALSAPWLLGKTPGRLCQRTVRLFHSTGWGPTLMSPPDWPTSTPSRLCVLRPAPGRTPRTILSTPGPQPIPLATEPPPPVTSGDLHKRLLSGLRTMAPNLRAQKLPLTHLPEISNWMPLFVRVSRSQSTQRCCL